MHPYLRVVGKITMNDKCEHSSVDRVTIHEDFYDTIITWCRECGALNRNGDWDTPKRTIRAREASTNKSIETAKGRFK